MKNLPFLSLVISLLTVICGSHSLRANPVGADVVNGSVRFTDGGLNLNIHQDSRLGIINWQSFSIAPNETTTFVQPANGATLNRVVSANPSALLGQLKANGTVLLINPYGILVGPQGRIETGGFLASTLDIADSDFLDGGDMRFLGTSEVSVTNLGKISAKDGDVVLLGNSVLNAGSIEAHNGTAALAAGEQILVMATGDERVFVEVGSSGTVEQMESGSVSAASVELKARATSIESAAVSVDGIVEATGVVRRGGRVFLSGGGGRTRVRGTIRAVPVGAGDGGSIEVESEGVEVGSGAVLDASGEDGGDVSIQGAESVVVNGKIDVIGSEGKGGTVVTTARNVTIGSGAVLDASGARGSGEVMVGGAFQGESDSRIARNAATTRVEEGALLISDSTTGGAAGRVIVWADQDTVFYGIASASALGDTGDGGLIEVSGKQRLDFNGETLTRSENGRFGTIFFDPDQVILGDFLGSGGADDGRIADGNINAGDGGSGDPMNPVIFRISDQAFMNAMQNGAVTVSAADFIIFSIAGILPDGGNLTLTAPEIGFDQSLRMPRGTVTLNATQQVTGGMSQLIDLGGLNGGILNLNTPFLSIGSIRISGGRDQTNSDPSLPGANGGNGGMLNVPANIIFNGHVIMNGGDGGNGSPPGIGGAAGIIRQGGVVVDTSAGPPPGFNSAIFTVERGRDGVDRSGGSGGDPGVGGNPRVGGVPRMDGPVIPPIVPLGPFGPGDPREFWDQIQAWLNQAETQEYVEYRDLPDTNGPDPVPERTTPRDERLLEVIYNKQRRLDRINDLKKRNQKAREIYRNIASAYAQQGIDISTAAKEELVEDIRKLTKDILKSGALGAGSKILGSLGKFIEGASDFNDLQGDLRELESSDDLLEAGYAAIFGPMWEIVGAVEGLNDANRSLDYADQALDSLNRSFEAERALFEEGNRLAAEIDQLATGLPPAVAQHFDPQTDAGVSNLYNWFR